MLFLWHYQTACAIREAMDAGLVTDLLLLIMAAMCALSCVDDVGVRRHVIQVFSLNALGVKLVFGCREQFLVLLRLRYSCPLFRLPSAETIRSQLHFHNTGPDQVGAYIDTTNIADSPMQVWEVVFGLIRLRKWYMTCTPGSQCATAALALARQMHVSFLLSPTSALLLSILKKTA